MLDPQKPITPDLPTGESEVEQISAPLVVAGQADPSEDQLIGRVLNGRFDLQAVIGEGGMGRVYRAVQLPLGRKVAIKVLHPTLPSSHDPHFQRRFLQEAALTAKLHSPNTVAILDYGQSEDGIYFIAMEYLEGRTLAEILKADGALHWQKALEVGQQICRSLHEAHQRGVVHRDLKPANIMLVQNGDLTLAKVLDFGLVKTIAPEGGQVDPEITQRGTFLGSPLYMSPEQARNEADARSDVYSLGVLLFHMLMGRTPFVSQDYVEVLFAHHRQPPPTFQQLRPELGVPPQLEAAVRKCLEKVPAQRFQSMEALLEGLREAGLAAGAHSGIFRSPVGLGTGHTPPAMNSPMFSAFTKGAKDAPPPPPPPAPVDPDQTKAYNLAADLGVVLPERVKAGESAGRSVGLLAVLGLLLVLSGIGVYSMVARSGGATVPSEATVATGPVAATANPASTGAPGEASGPTASPTAPATAPTPGMVRFRVMSEPAGARVMLLGKERGRTPFVLEVPPDADGIATVELTFFLEGHVPETVLTGGSGDVVLMQRLARRSGGRRPGVADESSQPAAVAPAVSAPTALPSEVVPASAVNPPASQQAAVVPASGTAGAPLPTGVQAAFVAPAPTMPKPQGEEVLPFGEGMEPPMKLEGPGITYPREALAAGVEGTMVVKCTISAQGLVNRCRVIKSVPFMEEAVLRALTSSLYKPVTFDGKAVSVDYVFNVRIMAGRRGLH